MVFGHLQLGLKDIKSGLLTQRCGRSEYNENIILLGTIESMHKNYTTFAWTSRLKKATCRTPICWSISSLVQHWCHVPGPLTYVGEWFSSCSHCALCYSGVLATDAILFLRRCLCLPFECPDKSTWFRHWTTIPMSSTDHDYGGMRAEYSLLLLNSSYTERLIRYTLSETRLRWSSQPSDTRMHMRWRTIEAYALLKWVLYQTNTTKITTRSMCHSPRNRCRYSCLVHQHVSW